MKRMIAILPFILLLVACVPPDNATSGQDSGSGSVQKQSVKVRTGSDGLSAEQRNVRDRLLQDNKPGAIQHLYIISAYSGQVLMYSTVKGKVTSSGKRLDPSTVNVDDGANSHRFYGFSVAFPDGARETGEVLQQDGTYGSSVEYIYWWDSSGIYHQQYIQGGMMVHVSSEPIKVKGVVLNLELQKGEE